MISRSFSGSNVFKPGFYGMDYDLFDGLNELNDLVRVLKRLDIIDVYQELKAFENIEYLRRIGFGDIKSGRKKS